ncbi:MAG: hypothetical protein AVDCRST_MAG96-839 [uncultured Segetibacter sp.]|uniref:Uncharacterized protein n=1 Tax=uncultured Segetibacter sp. TaxID=481133 RepID=A0A6J4RWV0_9BACT|nr:MAG: hypothetical protein AVDCRST_MAG96-839 [uncultured Segetibacter sp.]
MSIRSNPVIQKGQDRKPAMFQPLLCFYNLTNSLYYLIFHSKP